MANNTNPYRDIINTRTKSKETITYDSEWYAAGLGPLVGGKDGKIAPATGFACTEGITVQEQGTVSNVMPFDAGKLTEDIRPTDLYLREARFVNRLSAATVQMVRRIRAFDPEVLNENIVRPIGQTRQDRVRYATLYSRTYNSTLYELAREYLRAGIIVRSDMNYLKMALLEGMHLYTELYRLKNGTSFTSDLTSLDMAQALQNLEGLIQYFTCKADSYLDMDRFDIIHELRQLEKLTLQAKTDIIDYL